MVDTLRVLVPAQEEYATSDMARFLELYSGPSEVVEYICTVILSENPSDNQTTKSCYALGAALTQFGKGFLGWEYIIRKLLRSGVPIHNRKCYGCVKTTRLDCHLKDEETHLVKDGTPLDELFRYTRSPFDASEVAQRWLRILSTEGYDVATYLRTEFEGHLCQGELTYIDSKFGMCRQLVFQLESSPSITWEWHLDPLSSARIVREEYKHMCLSYGDYRVCNQAWEVLWPFNILHSIDVDFCTNQGFPHRFRWLEALAEERSLLWMKKKASKLARAQRAKAQSTMPGAWPV